MSGQLTGTLRLVRTNLRVGWRGLTGWTGLMVVLVAATGWSIAELYPTAADRRAYAESAGASPAVAAFNGRAYHLSELGAIIGYEVGFMALVGFPVIALHLAIRFTRHEEHAGRVELATAGRIGRLAPLAAAAATLLLSVMVLTAGVAVCLAALDLPVLGAVRYAIALGLFVLAHGGVGLLAAEVSREARTAYTLGLVFVLVTFLVRALVDGRGWDVVWLSPSSWIAETRAWGEGRWWPFLAYVGLTVAAVLLSVVMAARRDLGGGLLATPPGLARAGRWLRTPAGMAWRFIRPPLIGWLIGTTVWSAAFGALAGEMTDIVEQNPSILQALGVEKAEYLITSLVVLLCGIGASAFGVQAVVRLAHEESAGRLGLLLSTRVPRWRIWASWLGVVVLGTAAVLLVSALALGVCTAWSTGDPANIASALGAGLALLLPVLVVVSMSAALHAAGPRWAPAAWVLVAWTIVVGMLAETLRLPEWSRHLSPLYAVGQVPIEDPDAAALTVMATLITVLLGGGLAQFHRRELATG